MSEHPVRSDLHALREHDGTPARAGHRLLAGKVWPMLRDLGVAGGRLLASGNEAGVFTGPQVSGRHSIQAGEYTAAIPAQPAEQVPVHRWPQRQAPGRFDVVVLNLPYADLRLHDPHSAQTLLTLQNKALLRGLDQTKRGGILTAVASHEVLDDPDDRARLETRARADLVGAVRLPETLLRNDLDRAAPIDLLVLRRREARSHYRGQPFTDIEPVLAGDDAGFVNEYFAAHPQHVVGTQYFEARPDGIQDLKVIAYPDERVVPKLDRVLSQIVKHARMLDLTVRPSRWEPLGPEHPVDEPSAPTAPVDDAGPRPNTPDVDFSPDLPEDDDAVDL
ncbi:hypothetical protein GCM10028784_30260 [Myceligenerans cantabricum]